MICIFLKYRKLFPDFFLKHIVPFYYLFVFPFKRRSESEFHALGVELVEIPIEFPFVLYAGKRSPRYFLLCLIVQSLISGHRPDGLGVGKVGRHEHSDKILKRYADPACFRLGVGEYTGRNIKLDGGRR